ncbi:hypothetical protein RB195_014476 [Necator americanus]|uniref:CCHC-type domain-containing protein n=1 Tax=Necator americanus TaxID=51031 RepID=A0ABR1E094_NECAM
MVEQLSAEATADRLINPVGVARTIEQPAPARNQDVFRQHGIPDRRLIPSRSNCFNCGGVSHHVRQCPSLTVQLSAQGAELSSTRGRAVSRLGS